MFDDQGRPIHVKNSQYSSQHNRPKKAKVLDSHGADGNRTKYFHDDDKFGLDDLVRQERSGGLADKLAQNIMKNAKFSVIVFKQFQLPRNHTRNLNGLCLLVRITWITSMNTLKNWLLGNRRKSMSQNRTTC